MLKKNKPQGATALVVIMRLTPLSEMLQQQEKTNTTSRTS